MAARVSAPLPPSALACVHVARSSGVQRLELAVAPGLGRVSGRSSNRWRSAAAAHRWARRLR